jgi:hypothetical protein
MEKKVKLSNGSHLIDPIKKAQEGVKKMSQTRPNLGYRNIPVNTPFGRDLQRRVEKRQQGGSIVDYLKSKGQNYDYNSRKKLAE